ncbi:hypothetical protein pb186bvf_005272 [Paramecium bursaria]
MNNITVAIRIKPVQQNFKTIIVNGNTIHLLDPELEFNDSVDILKKNRIKDTQYDFDIILQEGCEQKEVYDKTTEPLLDDLLSGQNVTIFAYGATGAGKTFTMMGDQASIGIIPRALSDLYKKVQKQDQLQISFLEIYNETIRDLLTGKSCDLRDDGRAGLVVVGLFKAPAPNFTEANNLIKIGNLRRAKEPTGANENSTRSHTVLQVILPQCILNFVDLAGSERASQTTNRGQRMVEGAMINKSLLVLGNCIQALCSKDQFIPFRGSKLTRLLKDALQGNSKTCMIANVCPLHYEDTYNTLLYANRTKSIDTAQSINFTQVIDQLRNETEDLKKQIKRQNSNPKMTLFEQKEDINLQKHFDQEKSILEKMFNLEDIMIQMQLDIIDHEKSQSIQEKKEVQELIDQKNLKINQFESEQFDLAVKFKDLIQLRKRVYDIAMRQEDNAKQIYKSCLQDIERLKAQQAAKRNEMKKKFKDIEQDYLRQRNSNKSSSMPKYDEETLKEIKKSRLKHLNQQVKEGKL